MAPIPRSASYAMAVWTGKEIIASGTTLQSRLGQSLEQRAYVASSQAYQAALKAYQGQSIEQRTFIAGGRYNPVTDTWTSITSEGAPSPRAQARWSAVWTGEGMLFFGGWDGEHYFDETWFYRPAAD